jgi:hypothetical protein
MFALHMDRHEVEEIARNFLSQSYSIIKIEKVELVGNVWVVRVTVSSFDKTAIKQIMINGKTGHIMGWS